MKSKKDEKHVIIQEVTCPHCGKSISESEVLKQRGTQIFKDYETNLRRKKLIIGIISIAYSILIFFSVLNANMVRVDIGQEIDYSGFLLSILMFIVGIVTIIVRKKSTKSSYIIPACLYFLTGLIIIIISNSNSILGAQYLFPIFLGAWLILNMFLLKKVK